MKPLRSVLFASSVAALAATATAAEPEYTTIELEIDIAKPAKEVWSKVGGYCDISKWLNNVVCKITSGQSLSHGKDVTGLHRYEIWIAVHEGYVPTVVGDLQSIPRKQRSTFTWPIFPMERRAPWEMPADAKQGDLIG